MIARSNYSPFMSQKRQKKTCLIPSEKQSHSRVIINLFFFLKNKRKKLQQLIFKIFFIYTVMFSNLFLWHIQALHIFYFLIMPLPKRICFVICFHAHKRVVSTRVVPFPTFYSTFMLKMWAHLVSAKRTITIKISRITITSMYRHHPATSTTISTYEEPKMISGALWRMSLGLRLPTITYKHHHTSSISSSRWLLIVFSLVSKHQ